MLDELNRLLEYVDGHKSSLDTFRKAIIDENCLSKKSGKTRELTFQHLRSLYGLDPSIPLFRTLLHFWTRETSGRPLLAVLCVLPRDAIFRKSYDWIAKFNPGEWVSREHIEKQIEAAFPDRFSPASLKSIAQNLNSSWTKTGHLQGRVKKIRAQAKPTPASTAFALYLGYLQGIRGEELFHSPYTKVLDTRPAELMDMAETASQRSWIVMKRLGRVIEVLFPHLITDEERRQLHEQ